MTVITIVGEDKLKTLPNGLKNILNKNKIDDFDKIDNNVTKLIIENYHDMKISKFPDNLLELTIWKCNNFPDIEIPDNVNYIQIYKCSNFKKFKLPKNLINLTIDSCMNGPEYDSDELKHIKYLYYKK